jgi:hypothetical protein
MSILNHLNSWQIEKFVDAQNKEYDKNLNRKIKRLGSSGVKHVVLLSPYINYAWRILSSEPGIRVTWLVCGAPTRIQPVLKYGDKFKDRFKIVPFGLATTHHLDEVEEGCDLVICDTLSVSPKAVALMIGVAVEVSIRHAKEGCRMWVYALGPFEKPKSMRSCLNEAWGLVCKVTKNRHHLPNLTHLMVCRLWLEGLLNLDSLRSASTQSDMRILRNACVSGQRPTSSVTLCDLHHTADTERSRMTRSVSELTKQMSKIKRGEHKQRHPISPTIRDEPLCFNLHCSDDRLYYPVNKILNNVAFEDPVLRPTAISKRLGHCVMLVQFLTGCRASGATAGSNVVVVGDVHAGVIKLIADMFPEVHACVAVGTLDELEARSDMLPSKRANKRVRQMIFITCIQNVDRDIMVRQARWGIAHRATNMLLAFRAPATSETNGYKIWEVRPEELCGKDGEMCFQMKDPNKITGRPDIYNMSKHCKNEFADLLYLDGEVFLTPFLGSYTALAVRPDPLIPKGAYGLARYDPVSINDIINQHFLYDRRRSDLVMYRRRHWLQPFLPGHDLSWDCVLYTEAIQKYCGGGGRGGDNVQRVMRRMEKSLDVDLLAVEFDRWKLIRKTEYGRANLEAISLWERLWRQRSLDHAVVVRARLEQQGAKVFGDEDNADMIEKLRKVIEQRSRTTPKTQ